MEFNSSRKDNAAAKTWSKLKTGPEHCVLVRIQSIELDTKNDRVGFPSL